MLDDDPLWYKDAIIYELHVRAFHDSDGDGIGDFRGLTEKLDYLKDLGITAIWLLPFYPSPLRDDGYDIADYTSVHPAYGTLRDVKALVREAHRRGLRVITELVCNHTSDQHPWFQRARRAKPGTAARDFYVWSDTAERYKEARIIFKDFETSNWTWDPVAQAYYWHRFYSHQPDLNFENPAVRKAILRTLDLWFEVGVDGLRLDAVPYLHEREGTSCENLPETHAFLKELRRHVDARFANRMLLAEANQWPEDSVAYFGAGDECHMAFHFPVMPRLFMAIRMEDRFPIVDILTQTPAIPEGSQWALFLRNHDELTLEMVTDEERDYMYRVYAQDRQARINLGIRRRLAPLLGNHRRRIELMNGLLFSLPGTPVLYYGDEIGMGDNIYLGDRNGVRTPFQWSGDRNAGFSSANRQKLYLPVIVDPEYHYEAVNVEAQQLNPHSLLWWTRRLIALRKRFQAFGRGSLEFLQPRNHRILAFFRRYEDETILVVANLSRFVQHVEVDLGAVKGLVPVEMFGRVEFPAVGASPYFLTLGPHAFYWFSLVKATRRAGGAPAPVVLATLPASLEAADALALSELEEALPAYLASRRWFRGKARRLTGARVADLLGLPDGDGDGRGGGGGGGEAKLLFVRVEYAEGDPETYLLPLACAPAKATARDRGGDGEGRARSPREPDEERLATAIARVRTDGDGECLLVDAVHEPSFCEGLLDMIAHRRRLKANGLTLVASTTRAFKELRGPERGPLPVKVARAEQTNTSVFFAERLMLKLFRRLEDGMNPELEVGRFLTERTTFRHMAPLAGSIECVRAKGEPATIAVLQGYVPNQGDAWQYTLDALGRYFERVLARRGTSPEPPPIEAGLLVRARSEVPAGAAEVVGTYVEWARLLGQRTAELHLALASAPDDPAFAPEPFTTLYQRSIYQSMRSLATQVLALLRGELGRLRPEARADADALLARETAIFAIFRAVLDRKIGAARTRTHGDYHLGQVLYTGKDFVIIDFEGEPLRPLSERRIKRSPLRDVAGMLRSFDYAPHAALAGLGGTTTVFRATDRAALKPWARYWTAWVGTAFLREYVATVERARPAASILPRSTEDLASMLSAFLLEKAMYEVGYELNNRPDWAAIPLRGIRSLLEGKA